MNKFYFKGVELLKVKDVSPKLKEIFEYCKIPRRAQRAIAEVGLSPESLESNYKSFKANPERYKCLSPLSYQYRFAYDVTDRHLLYHYLPDQDLKKIVDSRTFLVGEQCDMNDQNEGKYAFNIAREELRKMHASDKVLKSFDEIIKTKIYSQIFIWSFLKNSAAAGMEKYGDTAIGMDSMQIDLNLNARLNEEPGLFHYLALKVCYNKQDQHNYIRNLMKFFIEAVNNKNALRRLVEESYVLKVLIFYSLVFKPPVLSNEKEIRFVILKTLDTKKSKFISLNGNNKFKYSAPITPDNLKEIIVNHMTESKEYGAVDIPTKIQELKVYLKKCGFDSTEVKETLRPY